jgi:hypothetical protein
MLQTRGRSSGGSYWAAFATGHVRRLCGELTNCGICMRVTKKWRSQKRYCQPTVVLLVGERT